MIIMEFLPNIAKNKRHTRFDRKKTTIFGVLAENEVVNQSIFGLVGSELGSGTGTEPYQCQRPIREVRSHSFIHIFKINRKL